MSCRVCIRASSLAPPARTSTGAGGATLLVERYFPAPAPTAAPRCGTVQRCALGARALAIAADVRKMVQLVPRDDVAEGAHADRIAVRRADARPRRGVEAAEERQTRLPHRRELRRHVRERPRREARR